MYKVLFTSNGDTMTWDDDSTGTITVIDPAGVKHYAGWGENSTLNNVDGDQKLLLAALEAHGPCHPENEWYDQTQGEITRWGNAFMR